MTRLTIVALLIVVAIFGVVRLSGESDAVATVEEPIDPASAYNPIVAGEQFPGGIRWVISRDGIRPIYEPAFVSATASPLENENLVIGVSIDGENRAYPVGLLAVREIVNDEISGVPIVVSWCPLCGTGTVHERIIDDDRVVLGNQGALWMNAMTWWDHETGSIWSQPLGKAIAGPHKGRELELLPSTLTTWSAWNAEHPDTLVLSGPVYSSGPHDAEFAVVVELGDSAVAYPIELVSALGVINDQVGGTPVAVVANPEGLWSVFSRQVEDLTVNLTLINGTLVENSTGSQWDVTTGLGQNEDARLELLPASTAFVKDFSAFWPTGRIFGG